MQGPVPCEIVEAAFEDTLEVLIEEQAMRELVKKSECSQADLDAKTQRNRELFMSRVQTHGRGMWPKDTMSKQYRRRKAWWAETWKRSQAQEKAIADELARLYPGASKRR